MARVTGLEPATSGVTGRRSNQLSYTRALGGGQLGEAPWSVNRAFLLFVMLADVGQRAVLEQETRDVRRSGRREDRLHDDQQRNRQQCPRRSPHPRPEAQRNQDRKRADRQPLA